jgi:hypothetical protein
MERKEEKEKKVAWAFENDRFWRIHPHELMRLMHSYSIAEIPLFTHVLHPNFNILILIYFCLFDVGF